ncbi:hypothetical protein BST28_13145 [Mycolicibacter kumamotonensis]|uniref:Uncharacterized protein n=1 Tax=Mycolicibacter kumamotonensis TaxID=354243 RepID=A0A1X0E2T3_9MYCO|nr:hypothetical protein [Mycolicibacter kumamotonensis]ORA79023.1 hypothetical protein BST28_13145 [Mycolicibacter kumamotonensis]
MALALSAVAARQRICAASDAIDAAQEVLRETSSDLVGNVFRVEVADRLETQERINRGLTYRIFGELADPPDGQGSIAAALYFACGPDHTDATEGRQHTTVTETGRLGWTNGTSPPRINHAHHPEELLHGDPDPPEEDVA